MADLNLNLDYFEHRKTRRLVGLLGRGAEVLPIRLWCYCGKFHAETGRLADYSEQEIESFAGWWGKPGDMLSAMRTAGFMDKDEQGWSMVGWSEHQGHIAAFKAHGKAMAVARWTKVKNHAASIATSTATGNAIADPNQPTKPTSDPPRADLPVELPNGFPKTEKDAVTSGNMMGLLPDFVRKAYHKALYRGGRDGRDVPIRNFQSYLQVEWSYEQDRQGRKHVGFGDGNGDSVPFQ